MVLGTLRATIIGAILDVLFLAVAVQTGWISPAKTLQANILTAILLVVVKWFLKQLLAR